MRQAQPGGEVPIHAVVVVAGDRHRGVGGGCLSIGRGRAGRGGRGGGGAASDGGGGQRVEPSDSASRGGKAGGRNRWDCDGRSLWWRRWGPGRSRSGDERNGSNRATRREGNGGEVVILPQKWMGAAGRGVAGSFAFLAVSFPYGRWEGMGCACLVCFCRGGGGVIKMVEGRWEEGWGSFPFASFSSLSILSFHETGFFFFEVKHETGSIPVILSQGNCQTPHSVRTTA